MLRSRFQQADRVSICRALLWRIELFHRQHPGFYPYFSAQLSHPTAPFGRIAAEHRSGYEVWTEDGPIVVPVLPAQLKSGLDRPCVGDWVELEHKNEARSEPARIAYRLERRTCLSRAAAGKSARLQIIAANIDIAFIVCALDRDFNLRRIERYLARIRGSQIRPVVILNKSDHTTHPEHRAEQVRRRCQVEDVYCTFALDPETIRPLQALLSLGATGVLIGSSGAGKSTLCNAWTQSTRMTTNVVRSCDERGQHTTTHRQMLITPGGGVIIDTPGLRELAMPDVSSVEKSFADIDDYAQNCRFRDCRHEHEPKCAVQAAIKRGELSPQRLEHFLALKREAQSFEARHDAAQRKQAQRAWGKTLANAKRQWRQKGMF